MLQARKAAPKKAVVTKVTKSLPKSIKPLVNKPIVDIDVDDEEAHILVKFMGEDFDFNWVTESLPNCCGVIEIGGFDYASGYANKNITQVMMNEAIIEALKHVFAIYSSKTFIATTVPNDKSCEVMAKALEASKMFTVIKTFKNNTGRMVKIWVSNN